MVAIEMAKIRGAVTWGEGREEHSLKVLIRDWLLLRRTHHETFAPCFMSLDIFQCLPVYSLWEPEFVFCCCLKII